jgi:hypothetical protein
MQIIFDDLEVLIVDAEGREVFRSRISPRNTRSGVGFVSEDRLAEEIPEGTAEVCIPGIGKPLVTHTFRFAPGNYFECALSGSSI